MVRAYLVCAALERWLCFPQADLTSATEIRDKEASDFAAAEKELVDTVDSLERATSVLKKNLGFMQTGKAAKALASMTSGLEKIVEASWVTSHQKSVIQSLLQSQTEESDEDLSLQPQATAAAYSSQSSGTPRLCKLDLV